MRSRRTKSGYTVTQVLSGRSNVFLLSNDRSHVLIDSVWDLKDLGFNAYVLPTPGHTVGSVSLIIDEEIAIVGDAMFGVFRNSIFPPFADHPDMLVESWGLLLKTNCSLFLPAHGSGKSREQVRKNYERLKTKLC